MTAASRKVVRVGTPVMMSASYLYQDPISSAIASMPGMIAVVIIVYVILILVVVVIHATLLLAQQQSMRMEASVAMVWVTLLGLATMG
jgi:hypothetical protein